MVVLGSLLRRHSFGSSRNLSSPTRGLLKQGAHSFPIVSFLAKISRVHMKTTRQPISAKLLHMKQPIISCIWKGSLKTINFWGGSQFIPKPWLRFKKYESKSAGSSRGQLRTKRLRQDSTKTEVDIIVLIAPCTLKQCVTEKSLKFVTFLTTSNSSDLAPGKRWQKFYIIRRLLRSFRPIWDHFAKCRGNTPNTAANKCSGTDQKPYRSSDVKISK